MKQKNKKIISYVYLVLSIWAILFLLFSTIYLYKNIQEIKTKYGNCTSNYSDLNKKYKDCLSDNICVCVCPINPIIGGCATVHPDYLQQCCGEWARENKIIIPMCIGRWKIVNGQCHWNCQNS